MKNLTNSKPRLVGRGELKYRFQLFARNVAAYIFLQKHRYYISFSFHFTLLTTVTPSAKTAFQRAVTKIYNLKIYN